MISTSTQNYIEILEKTNQQLSFWYLPYEVAIGFLTIAIAVLTIGFSILLWRQNINYREIINKIIDEQKKNLKEQMKEDALELLEQHRAELQNQAASATGAIRGEIEERLASINDTLQQYTARTPSSLTNAQKQSILSLLRSFGADDQMVVSVANVFEGHTPHRTLGGAIAGGLSMSQNQAIISLLQSFGAESIIIDNVRKVLERNFSA